MTAAIQPDRVYVVAVGLERYDYGDPMDLPGAADEAERFARWAIACGVPPQQVLLACSRKGQFQPGGGLPGAISVGTTRQDLETVFTTTLGNCKGDLLLVFWCGHGVLSEWHERALYTSDAMPGNGQNLLVDELLNFLSSTALTGFSQQIVFVDACANFLKDMSSFRALPTVRLAKGSPREIVQFSYYSASQGQVAQFDKNRHQATFSTTILEWLEQQSTVLPPDVDLLTDHVGQTFEELRRNKVLRSRPVYRKVRFTAENVIEEGTIPVSGLQQQAIQAAGMSVWQVSRLAAAVMGLPMLSTAEGRQRLAEALGIRGGAIDEAELREAVEDQVLGRKVRQMLDAARGQATTSSDIFDVHQVELLWQRQLWIADPLDVLQGATLQDVRRAFNRTIPQDKGTAPQDLDEALDRAANYRISVPATDTPLYRLVANLEHATQRRVPDSWFKLPANRLPALRQTAAQPLPATSRLTIDLRRPKSSNPSTSQIVEFSWPRVITGHLRIAGGKWIRKQFPCAETPSRVATSGESGEISTADVQRAVGRILMWATTKNVVGSFTVGFVAERAAFEQVPESWAFGNELAAPRPLWFEHPTMLHSAERLSARRSEFYQKWAHNAEAIKQWVINNPPNMLWIDPEKRQFPEQIRDSIKATTASFCGLEFEPGDLWRQPFADPILAAVAEGAPYVIWSNRQQPNWPAAKAMFQNVINQGPFEDLPMRLHSMRTAHPPLIDDSWRLLWDEPGQLPELGQLKGGSS